jgi:GntR family transcriptional regulator
MAIRPSFAQFHARPDNIVQLSPVPLYTQIKDILRTQILDGSYTTHQQMPSEAEMMRTFGVSRITIRQALGDLQKEGLIFRIHGKGTFVSKPKAFQDLTRLQGFGEAMSGMGHETCSRLIGARLVPADKVVAARLALPEGTMVSELRRLRFLDRGPISLDVSYLPADIGERLAGADLASRDVFLILENDFGLALTHAELKIEAVLADDALATLLRVPEGSPVLRIERLTYTDGQRPLDFEYLYYRGDAFQYRLTIERGPASRARPSTMERTLPGEPA